MLVEHEVVEIKMEDQDDRRGGGVDGVGQKLDVAELLD